MGKAFNVSDENIKKALENYIPLNSRSQLIIKDSNKIFLDAYNANPSSMKAAIENFANIPGKNKTLILGAMMEMGKDSDIEHQAIIDLILKYSWNNIVLVGKEFVYVPGEFMHFKNVEEAKNWFKQQHFKNEHILLKGSRSMQMEKLLE